MSGTATGANLPVTITVTGAQQAEAAISRVGQAGAAAANNIRGSMGGATQSLTSFVVEIASGSTSLATLGQRASGLLPMLGPAGVFAAGAVTVASLAAQLLNTDRATQQLRESQEALGRNLQISNGFFETQNEAAERLEQNNRANATTATAAALAIQTQAQAVRALRLAELEATMDQVRLAREIGGENTSLPAAVQRRVGEFERLRLDLSDGATAISQLEQRLTDLRSGRPSGRQVDQAARDAGRSARSARSGATYTAPTDDEMGARLQSGVGGPRDRAIEEMRQFERQQELINAGIERAGPIFSAHERQIEMFTRALNAGVITEDQFSQMVERSTEQLDRQIVQLKNRGEGVNNMGRDLGMTFSSAFEDAILKGRRFSDVLKSIAQDIARIIVRQSITAPLGNALSQAFGSLDFGSMFSGMFGGARAEGGPVFSGRAYMVGERGPELFVPGTAGGIVPNSGGITVNQSFSVDARGADQGVIPRLRAEMIAIAQASNAQLLDAIQRGGSVAKTVGRRA